MNYKCQACVYWQAVDDALMTVRMRGGSAGASVEATVTVRVGTCMRWPPLASRVESAPDVGALMGRWPLTAADAWCGEWVSVNDPRFKGSR